MRRDNGWATVSGACAYEENAKELRGTPQIKKDPDKGNKTCAGEE
jgi:hypothetical protein